jgi:hypothetical protein
MTLLAFSCSAFSNRRTASAIPTASIRAYSSHHSNRKGSLQRQNEVQRIDDGKIGA